MSFVRSDLLHDSQLENFDGTYSFLGTSTNSPIQQDLMRIQWVKRCLFNPLLPRGLATVTLLSLLFPLAAEAWNDKTHIAIAYVAYKRLSRHARDRVDEIVVLHPLYSQWTKGTKLGEAGLLAFMHAAMWPNCIQTPQCPGYIEDGADHGMIPGPGQEAWQNAGFTDMLMHKYWHLIATPVPEGASGPAPQPNIKTQLQILTETLNSNAEDRLKAYDLAWVENLVAEIHQPLNCVNHFSATHPKGDRNGRDVKVDEAGSIESLHDYWDNLLGLEEDFESAMREGESLNGVQDPNGWWEFVDFERWISESVDLAKRAVYTPSVVEEQGGAVLLDANYRKKAKHIAIEQAALAANRLALLLNKNLQ
jgi:hypothetical protein